MGRDDRGRRRRRGGHSLTRREVWAGAPAGYLSRMWFLILLILALIVFGVVGAIKIAFWVLLIALAVAVVAGFLGRGLFGSRGAL